MPTTRPRHGVTETPDVSAALAVAARRWPADRGRPTRLLRLLIAEGMRSIEPEVADRQSSRREALRRVSGKYSGLYEPGYLDALRSEWPE